MTVTSGDVEASPLGRAHPRRDLVGMVDRAVQLVSKIFFWIAGLGLVGMLALVFADIIGIKILARPVPGGTEILTFLAVVAIGFAIAQVQVLRGHVQVDFVVSRLPSRAKWVLESLTLIFSMALFVLLATYSFKYGAKLKATGEVSMTQNIPFYPFVWALGVCYVVTFLVLALELAGIMVKAVQRWTR